MTEPPNLRGSSFGAKATPGYAGRWTRCSAWRACMGTAALRVPKRGLILFSGIYTGKTQHAKTMGADRGGSNLGR